MKGEETDVIDCQVVKEKLGRLLDGELPRKELSVVRSHIEGCPGCQQELGTIQALSAALDALVAPPVPAGTADLIMVRVRQQGAGSGRSWGILEFWKPWPVAMRFAAAGTVVVACLVGVMLGSATSSPASRTRSEMAWVGLASGAPIATAYQETAR
jgi:anti-sigma factor RsiW